MGRNNKRRFENGALMRLPEPYVLIGGHESCVPEMALAPKEMGLLQPAFDNLVRA